MLEVEPVRARSGWTVVAFDEVPSTNDVAAALRGRGAGPRTVVVAERQTHGRGRAGRTFASPPGGLYASLLLRVPASDLPGPLVGTAALAVADAVEAAAAAPTQVKWPNDVRLRGRKVAGLLLEAGGAPDGEGRLGVVLGVGVNVARVPEDLPPEVALATTAIDPEAGRVTRREDLLVGILAGVDRRLAALADPAGRAEVEAAYARRLALRGARVRFRVGDREGGGVLLGASLERGLLVEGPDGTAAWWEAGHVQDLREA